MPRVLCLSDGSKYDDTHESRGISVETKPVRGIRAAWCGQEWSVVLLCDVALHCGVL